MIFGDAITVRLFGGNLCENVLASLFIYFIFFKSHVLDIEIRCLVVFFCT